MTITSFLDSSGLNAADLSSSTIPREAALASEAKTGVTLPSAAELGHHPRKPATAQPAHQPKAWTGVSSMVDADHNTASPAMARQQVAGAPAAAAESSPRVSLPSAAELGHRAKPKAAEKSYEVKAWGGISNSLSESAAGDYATASYSPAHARAKATSAVDSDAPTPPPPAAPAAHKVEIPSVVPAKKSALTPAQPAPPTREWRGLSSDMDQGAPSPEFQRRSTRFSNEENMTNLAIDDESAPPVKEKIVIPSAAEIGHLPRKATETSASARRRSAGNVYEGYSLKSM